MLKALEMIMSTNTYNLVGTNIVLYTWIGGSNLILSFIHLKSYIIVTILFNQKIIIYVRL